MRAVIGKVVVGVLAFIVGLATAAPAFAHGAIGIIQYQPEQVAGPQQLRVRVRLIYANDTHPVTQGATVNVEGVGPSGARVGPIPLTYEGNDGYYGTTVTFPVSGSWALTIRAQNPAAAYQKTVSVAGPPVTTPPAPAPTAPPSVARPAPTPPPVTTSPVAPAPTASPLAGPASIPAETSTTTAASAPTTETTSPAADTAATEDPAPSTTPDTAGPSGTAEVALTQIADEPGGGGPAWGLVAAGAVGAAAMAAAVVLVLGRRPTA